MRDALELIGVGAGAVIAVSTVLALVGRVWVRRVFVPWMVEHLVGPLEETRHQVTAKESEPADEPTLPELLDSLRDQVGGMDESFSGHLGWSSWIVRQINQRLDALEDREGSA